MKIVVLVKQTPDTAELPRVTVDQVTSGNVAVSQVINPWDEYAAEEAIQLADRYGADTVAMTMGSPEAADVLKHALAMGIASAQLIDSTGLPTGDALTTARVLAAAVRTEGDVDIVLTGSQSVDENNSAVYVGVAQTLGVPVLSHIVEIVEIADGHVTAKRVVEGVTETVRAPLPLVISVGKEINDPRYPSFMGIRKASRANIPTITPEELGIDQVAIRTHWANMRKPAERTTTIQIMEGASVEEQVSKLVDALLSEKII